MWKPAAYRRGRRDADPPVHHQPDPIQLRAGPELGGGYGIADFVVGRCLVEVKASFDPVPSIGD
jgi:hypothetical protein